MGTRPRGTMDELGAIPGIDGVAPSHASTTVHMAFLMHGIATIVPFNFVVTLKPYFDYKFRNNPAVLNFYMNAFSLSSLLPQLLFQVANIYLSRKIPARQRVIKAAWSLFFLMIIYLAMVDINAESVRAQAIFFAVTMVVNLVINSFGAIAQSSWIGLSGLSGGSCTVAFLNGQAACGLVAAVTTLLAIAGGDRRATAYIVLSLAVALLGASVAFAHYLDKQGALRDVSVSISSDDLILPRTMSARAVTRKITPYAVSVFLIFAVTLSVYPSILQKIQPVEKSSDANWRNLFFAPVVCYLTFNLCDLLGRSISGFVVWPKNPAGLVVASSLRLVLVALVLLCNVQPHTARFSPVFLNDLVPFYIVVVIGLSNGYLCGVCMQLGPRCVPREWTETAGTIMASAIAVGLATGSAVSFLLNALVS